MNVAFDPWIPVVTTAGKRQLASLCEVLTSGEQFADLAVRPHERVALMRLFLCVAHAALDGPKDYDEWLRSSLAPARCGTAILGEVEGSVRVVSSQEKPWLQVAGLSKGGSRTRKIDWTIRPVGPRPQSSTSRMQRGIIPPFSITPAWAKHGQSVCR